jgi:large subunit ribosomal protein L18
MNSKILIKYGWPKEMNGSLKSIPASYLTGFLIGKKIISSKKQDPILDIGMIRNLHKTKIYAFLKGLVDSGIKMKYKEGIFPEKERIEGKHMKKDFSKTFNEIKSKIEKAPIESSIEQKPKKLKEGVK